MEITQSIQINFNFPKIYRIDNDDLEFGSILQPGLYNITVNTNSTTTFTCILAPGQQIKTITYNGSIVSYTTVDQVVTFVIDTTDEGVTGEIVVEAESQINGCEVFDLNMLNLPSGNNNITVRFRNVEFLDSNISNVLSYQNITTLQGTT